MFESFPNSCVEVSILGVMVFGGVGHQEVVRSQCDSSGISGLIKETPETLHFLFPCEALNILPNSNR